MLPFRQPLRMRALIPLAPLSMLMMAVWVGQRLASEPSRIVVLYSRADPPTLQTRCPEGQCTYLGLEDFSCPEGVAPPTEVLIVGGHSLPPKYLNAPPAAIAEVARCLRPRLVVLDTCYGFSSPLLDELASVQPSMLVLGATFKLPPAGLLYEEAFYTARTPQERARHVRTRSGARLENWWTNSEELRATLETVATWKPPMLVDNLQRKFPNLVRVPVPGRKTTLLIAVPPERFRP